MWARAQGLLPALVVASAAVNVGWLFGAELVGIPGLGQPIPAIRIFPAVIAVGGALVLLERWHTYELIGVWSVRRHRASRYVLGVSIVLVAGCTLSATAGSPTILVIGILFYAAFALAVSALGALWWIVAVAALYGQLFIRDYDRFHPHPGLLATSVAVSWVVYLVRGQRSPT